MGDVTVQMGHAEPRGGTLEEDWLTGQTGSFREMEWTTTFGPILKAKLEAAGHRVTLIGSNYDAPGGDVFIALHLDSPDFHLASVGHPFNDPTVIVPEQVRVDSEQLAHTWQQNHIDIAGWSWEMRGPYTVGLRRYYMWKPHPGRAGGGRYRAMYLAEHDAARADGGAWVFAHMDAIADAHVATVNSYLGGTVPPTPSKGDPDMARAYEHDGTIYVIDGGMQFPMNSTAEWNQAKKFYNLTDGDVVTDIPTLHGGLLYSTLRGDLHAKLNAQTSKLAAAIANLDIPEVDPSSELTEADVARIVAPILDLLAGMPSAVVDHLKLRLS